MSVQRAPAGFPTLSGRFWSRLASTTPSEAQIGPARRCAAATCELEAMEQAMAQGEPIDRLEYSRLDGVLRRSRRALGLDEVGLSPGEGAVHQGPSSRAVTSLPNDDDPFPPLTMPEMLAGAGRYETKEQRAWRCAYHDFKKGNCKEPGKYPRSSEAENSYAVRRQREDSAEMVWQNYIKAEAHRVGHDNVNGRDPYPEAPTPEESHRVACAVYNHWTSPEPFNGPAPDWFPAHLHHLFPKADFLAAEVRRQEAKAASPLPDEVPADGPAVEPRHLITRPT